MKQYKEINYGYGLAGTKYYSQHIKLLADGKRFRLWNESSQRWVSDWIFSIDEAKAEFDRLLNK